MSSMHRQISTPQKNKNKKKKKTNKYLVKSYRCSSAFGHKLHIRQMLMTPNSSKIFNPQFNEATVANWFINN